MPAAQLSKLKVQIQNLAWLFTRPQDFYAGLHALLKSYTDVVYRPGKALPAAPLLPSYRVPPLVVQQLEVELSPLCTQAPQAALAVIDVLWADPYVEVRELATYLLGRLPVDDPQPVIDRIQQWTVPTVHPVYLDALLINGSFNLRKHQPNAWLNLIRAWLGDQRNGMTEIGLTALAPLAADANFENLPAIFSMIEPLLLHPAGKWQATLGEIVVNLARRTPNEVSYLLQTALRISDDPNYLRFLRKIQPNLPEKTQESVRAFLPSRSTK